MEITVRCRACNWEGYEKELDAIENIDDGKLEVCPSCKDPWNLEDNELQEFHEAIISDVFGLDF